MASPNKQLTPEHLTNKILNPLEDAGFTVDINHDGTSYTDYVFSKNGIDIPMEYSKSGSYRVNGPHILMNWDSQRALKNVKKIIEKITDRYTEKYNEKLVKDKKKNLVIEAKDTLELVLENEMFNISTYSSSGNKVSCTVDIRRFLGQEVDYSNSESINFYLKNDGTIESLRYNLRDLTSERVQKIGDLMDEVTDLWESSVL